MRIQAARRKIVPSWSRCGLWSERPRSIKGLLMIRASRMHAGPAGNVDRIVLAMPGLPKTRDPGLRDAPGETNGYFDSLSNAGIRVARGAETGSGLGMFRVAQG
jgi:hypothetical protein